MKKKIKSLIAILTVGLLAIQVTPVSATIEMENNKIEVQKELIEMFPEFEQSLKENTTGELLQSTETYVKLEPKENIKTRQAYGNETTQEDYIVSYHSKGEFEEEFKKNLVQTRGIGTQEGGTTSWLKLTLQVYPGSGNSDYMAYNFCSWLTKPKFRFKDGIGISFSDGLVASGDATTRRAQYRSANPYSEIGGILNMSVDINPTGNGVLATGYLQAANVLEAFPNVYEYHNWMIQTGVSYNNNNVNKGWITGHYLHKQLAIGGIGMDIKGVPSLSVGGSTDTHSGAIYVNR